MDEDTFGTTGGTGLAMEVGRQRAEIDRLHDDTNRDLDTIRTELAQLRTSIETREKQTLDLFAKLAEAVAKIAPSVEHDGQPGGTSANRLDTEDDESPEPLPTRNAGERPADYRRRVLAWAWANGKADPPATGPVTTGSGYEAKVARFYGVE